METVNFDVIEEQKENIEPAKEGRSASSLKGIFSMPHNQLRKQQLEERLKIEKELELLDELDDPIQPFLDYIQWIRTNYPSGASVESGLVQVLERCTSQFRDFDFYKNDSRYLNVWLTYAKYSENPRDIFVYLARKEIGTNLALYYEEYANYLELNKRSFQAGKVYEEGIHVKARPLSRLERRFEEFKVRTENRPHQESEPQSPVFPVRSALSLKSGGSLFSAHDGPRLQKRKLEIFNDDGNDLEEAGRSRTKGWDALGTSAFRNKENRLEATPWAGETLKQNNRKRQHSNKISVFQDEGSGESQEKVFKIIENPGKKTEKVDMNFDLLYRQEEYSIQEVLFQLRVYSKKMQNTKSQSDSMKMGQNNQLLPQEVKVFDKNNDATIQLNSKRDQVPRPSSPTMTMFTREAKDEVYSMFNQRPKDKDNEGQENDHQLVYDDFTEQLTRPNLNDLTEKVSDLGLKKNLLENSLKDITDPTKELKPSEDFVIVDPVREDVKENLLLKLSPPLSTYEGFHSHDRQMKMSGILKRSSTSSKQMRQLFLNFNVGNYNMVSLLGEGGFATVYLAESMNGGLKAIKVQQPASSWEFYILKQLEQRLSGRSVLNSIIVSEEVHLYEDESYLVLDYVKQGTILDVVNLYKATGRNVDEALVIFITVEILKLIEEMHSVGILHGDLKPDNCMLRLEPGTVGKYDSQGSNGWSRKGIKLIDFGRSIDMTMFASNSRFKTNIKTDNQDCPEMRNNTPWTYQIDYFGVAGILHTMLFGTFIETTQRHGRHKLASPLKRYWNQELWNPLFDLLINSESFDKLPMTSKLRDQRLILEKWLMSQGSALSSIIRDIETGLN